MEFIDFLKYGAIGISLALAILSYKLLSKEQDKPDVREPMLKSIRTYFLFALFLSIFFGALETATKLLSPAQPDHNEALLRIWENNFSEYPDSTIKQKEHRIENSLHAQTSKIDTADVCTEALRELANCRKELDSYENGFYQNVIKLKNAVSSDPDGWINIGYQLNAKQEAIGYLRAIFRSLGKDYDKLSDDEIVAKWMEFKSKWSKDKLEYVFLSDISAIVREFLNQYN